jgi:hypothetical protein
MKPSAPRTVYLEGIAAVQTRLLGIGLATEGAKTGLDMRRPALITRVGERCGSLAAELFLEHSHEVSCVASPLDYRLDPVRANALNLREGETEQMSGPPTSGKRRRMLLSDVCRRPSALP